MNTRVTHHTPREINQRIEDETLERIRGAFAAGPEEIERKLKALDQEWDIERVLQVNAAGLSVFGFLMAGAFSRRWLVLPATVATFLLQHATQRWCPPLPLLRRLGVRTAREIERERYALKLLRGDFREIDKGVNDREQLERLVEGLRKDQPSPGLPVH